ncbi:hypothetical protein AGLY_009553 [Aphis glycines]|uniref:Uncharacterized protein n=1 Tax=Aphis glycines TaxID=307491 RepID=A0A6G0TI63_APHGL|nr:hypothetical protein AGLY_009553 [Aphis glycines]
MNIRTSEPRCLDFDKYCLAIVKLLSTIGILKNHPFGKKPIRQIIEIQVHYTFIFFSAFIVATTNSQVFIISLFLKCLANNSRDTGQFPPKMSVRKCLQNWVLGSLLMLTLGVLVAFLLLLISCLKPKSSYNTFTVDPDIEGGVPVNSGSKPPYLVLGPMKHTSRLTAHVLNATQEVYALKNGKSDSIKLCKVLLGISVVENSNSIFVMRNRLLSSTLQYEVYLDKSMIVYSDTLIEVQGCGQWPTLLTPSVATRGGECPPCPPNDVTNRRNKFSGNENQTFIILTETKIKFFCPKRQCSQLIGI